ncbi:MAG: lactonase family protein [Isosphaeraceae bacterium]|nr:lactonase family protein [Isosphaeraceae bacterium]
MKLFMIGMALALAASSASAESMRVYIGTYTGNGKSRGIYQFDFDPSSGRLTPLGIAAEEKDPSFLAIHPNRKTLYAVSELGDYEGKPTGAVASFAVDPSTGKLRKLNAQPSGGGAPCHLVVDKTGRAVLVANYSGGSVESLPIEADGSLGKPASVIRHEGKVHLPQRQGGPRGHSINLDAANRFAVAADLGLDELRVYEFDAAKATLTPHDPPFAKVGLGTGPRHFAFHPSQKFAYTCLEITSGVTALTYDATKGVLEPIQTLSTLPPEGKEGNSTAQILVHPSGKFVYVSNRGHDSIAGFAVDESTGKLTALDRTPTGGKTPRNFGIDPSGRYLIAANQNSDTLVVFAIDAATGKLTQVGEPVSVPSPVCVAFMPAGL